jgi:hypothetical protein
MSEIKVNKISPRTACGTTTLGDSGDTFTIPAGVTITNSGTAAGFGATGAASWDTTVKTTGFTAVSGVGYFVNTTAGAITVNLPAGVAGDVVAIKDYANTFDTYAVTLVQNGSDKIGGSTVNATLSVEGLAVTLVFVDSTQGWLVTDNGTQDTAPTEKYVTATGGTITCSGDYRIHTFTGPGAFCVSCAGNPAGSVSVDYLVVAGGGAGGSAAPGNTAAGGGAGGFRESPGTASGSYTVSPLGVSPAVALPVSVQPYTITVGGGGTGSPSDSSKGGSGTVSTFSTITSAGGGGGGSNANRPGSDGGSGGGGSGGDFNQPAGDGNIPSVSPPQGSPGGNSAPSPGSPPDGGAGGGGGAIEAGVDGGVPGATSGRGGAGTTTSISASSLAYAGGGGGGSYPTTTGGAASPCGTGGAGGNPAQGPQPCSVAGTVNRGGGGGGAGGDPAGPTGIGANGGSGIVIIRYKFQN